MTQLTYTARRNLCGTLTNDSSVANLANADALVPSYEAEIVGMRPWPFLEGSQAFSTVAAQQTYGIAVDCDRLEGVTITIGSYTYAPKMIQNRLEWDRLNQVSVSSDIPTACYQYGTSFSLYPTSASSNSNAGAQYYRKKAAVRGTADYTTGNIASIANGGTAVTGSGTSWNASMIGLYIRITPGTSANLGDGYWYKITAVGSTTTLTLEKAYKGTAISAGSAAYTIGELSIFPEGYDLLPVYKYVWTYFSSTQPEPTIAAQYEKLYTNLLKGLVVGYGAKLDTLVLDDGINEPTPINPNLYPRY